jgi:hypothetical protein
MVPTDFELAGEMYPYIRIYSSYPIKPDSTGGYLFFPDGFGFNYLDFKTARLDSVFTFGFDAEKSGGYFDWRLSVMAFDQNDHTAPVWVDDELHLDKDTFEVKDFNSYSDIMVMPTLVNPALQILNNHYHFSVDDTSIVIKENWIAYGPSKIILSDPQDLSSSLRVTFNAAEDAAIGLKVFTVGGERIFSASGSIIKNDEERLRWDGKNENGETVASGVYVVRAEIGSTSKIFKVLVIR